MKHVRKISKNMPLSAFWWQWFGRFGQLKAGGAASPKAAYINALFGTDSTLDPRDV